MIDLAETLVKYDVRAFTESLPAYDAPALQKAALQKVCCTPCACVSRRFVHAHVRPVHSFTHMQLHKMPPLGLLYTNHGACSSHIFEPVRSADLLLPWATS